MLDKKFFNELGKETSLMYRKLIFDPKGGGKNAKDVYGQGYKSYSSVVIVTSFIEVSSPSK